MFSKKEFAFVSNFRFNININILDLKLTFILISREIFMLSYV